MRRPGSVQGPDSEPGFHACRLSQPSDSPLGKEKQRLLSLRPGGCPQTHSSQFAGKQAKQKNLLIRAGYSDPSLQLQTARVTSAIITPFR